MSRDKNIDFTVTAALDMSVKPNFSMRALRSTIILLCLGAVAAVVTIRAADILGNTKVGEAGDPDNLVFEGLQTFTDAQIRHALAIKASYLLAAHPQADLAPFLNDLQKKVHAGYQAAGFPDAQVDVSFDSKLLQAHVKVLEGPRFKAGQIRVAGTRSASARELVRWFTTPADKSKKASGLNTPGKAERPDDPMWVKDDPADFSATWATQAVAQVESALAEQGFFFPQAKVELQRDNATGIADLLITIQSEGPPGVIDQIKVTGQHLHSANDIIRYLQLRRGLPLTAERLIEARRKLRDCGRFWNFAITPEYASDGDKISSRRVNLHVEVKEQEGVPHLNKPLSPTQQALVRMCEWIEQFPSRDEDIEIKVSSQDKIPFDVSLVLSPRHGLLLNSADLQGVSPVSAGFLLTDETIQFCAWASGSKLACKPHGSGGFFLHLLPEEGENTNRFNLSLGAGHSSTLTKDDATTKPVLKFDVQLSRAAFLDLQGREGSSCRLEVGQLVLSNSACVLRADARSGRVVQVDGLDGVAFHLRFNAHVWNQACQDFERRAKSLTNIYEPGRGFTTFLGMAATEAVRGILTTSTNWSVSPDERARAVSAFRKLLSPELFAPVNHYFSGDETNRFSVPADDVDRSLAQSDVVAYFTGFLFDLSNELFHKHSWPWTISREGAFVIMNQGRYTGSELERLCGSEATGPIGFLVMAQLLARVDSTAAKGIAMQGLTRLTAQNFLNDCNLFLHGDSGLARSFARLTTTLRTLPDDELTALANALPESEATLLRDSAAALRAQPEGKLDSLLAPALTKYWEQSLRARVRAAIYRLTTPPARTASLPETNQHEPPDI